MRIAPTPTQAVAKLAAYDPGHDLVRLRAKAGSDGLVELGSNENGFGPSPRALAVVRGADNRDLMRYPDPQGHALRAQLARQCGVSSQEIALGNGSHELLMLLAQAYAGADDEVMYSEFGFAVYAIAASSVGARAVVVTALTNDDEVAPRGHDLDAFARAITTRTRLVYLANPNNPTGTVFPVEALANFMRRVPADVLVVVDEAYVEFSPSLADATALGIREGHPNLVVTRTFSKIHGLAGLRIGYLIASPEVVATIDRLRETFNINALALSAASAALADPDHLANSREYTRRQRVALTAALRGLGLRVPESAGNFVLADFEPTGRDVETVEQGLLARGVVVRPMRGYGLPRCLRITVGSDPEQARLFDALKAVLA